MRVIGKPQILVSLLVLIPLLHGIVLVIAIVILVQERWLEMLVIKYGNGLVISFCSKRCVWS